jgi:hypothetical protein
MDSRKPITRMLFVCLSSFVLGGAAETKGCINRPGEPGLELGGSTGAVWLLDVGDRLTVTVRSGGATVRQHDLIWGAGARFDLDGVSVDLDALCARPDVACPQEVFPGTITMTQPGSDRHLVNLSYNPEGPLASVDEATLLGNLDSDGNLRVFLGVGAAATGSCGLLSVSYATGRVTSDRSLPERGVAIQGEIIVGMAAGCVSGASAATGLTLELRLAYSATRQK